MVRVVNQHGVERIGGEPRTVERTKDRIDVGHLLPFEALSQLLQCLLSHVNGGHAAAWRHGAGDAHRIEAVAGADVSNARGSGHLQRRKNVRDFLELVATGIASS